MPSSCQSGRRDVIRCRRDSCPISCVGRQSSIFETVKTGPRRGVTSETYNAARQVEDRSDSVHSFRSHERNAAEESSSQTYNRIDKTERASKSGEGGCGGELFVAFAAVMLLCGFAQVDNGIPVNAKLYADPEHDGGEDDLPIHQQSVDVSFQTTYL